MDGAMNTPEPLDDARHFTHEAMRTTFSLYLRGVEETTANGIFRECIEQLDAMEARLSRFFEGGDVFRINHLRAGETLYVSETCHQCLLLALQACADTCGLFDITLGKSIAHLKSGGTGPAPVSNGRLVIHPDVAAITCEEPGREIDLGGIGKGFALDQLKILLVDWGVEDALLCAGASSLLAIGPGAWPVDLAGDEGSHRITLTDQALSASGIGIQGVHFVHPGGEQAMPVSPCKRLWVSATSAALAEVWSTALMLVEPDEIPNFIAGVEGLGEIYLDRDGSITVLPD
jgi:thiamine biosynthesis lipoprotein